MLAKVSSNSTVPYEGSKNYFLNTQSFLIPSQNLGDIYNGTITLTGATDVSYTYKIASVTSTGNIKWLNGEYIVNMTWFTTANVAKTLSWLTDNTITCSALALAKPGTKNIQIQHRLTANYSNKYADIYCYWQIVNVNIPKTVSTHKCLPRELQSIGSKASCTLFGYHTDNTRYTGE